MEQLLQYLNAIHFISDSMQDYLMQVMQYKKIHRKEFLLKEGKICRHLCFIKKGLVRSYYIKNGIEVCSWFMKEQDVIISIESFYAQQPSYENLQAIEETEVFMISYDKLQELFLLFPESNIIGRLITQFYHQHWARQLFAIRMQTAEERYKWLMENHPELLLRVPAKFISTYLDIAEVTLSKIKAKLLNEN